MLATAISYSVVFGLGGFFGFLSASFFCEKSRVPLAAAEPEPIISYPALQKYDSTEVERIFQEAGLKREDGQWKAASYALAIGLIGFGLYFASALGPSVSSPEAGLNRVDGEWRRS